MRYRTLGKTGWQVGAVSMGCWQLGGQWGEVDQKTAIDTVHAALDGGINLFDTADVYGIEMGTSETLLGKALKGRRDKAFIASKVGNWGGRYDDGLQYNSVYSVINCCHASLHRLGVDHIDLYQSHIAKPKKPEVLIEAFEKLIEEGKIRAYGISTDAVDSVKAMNATGRLASAQVNYSILKRDAEAEYLPYCLENKIGVLLRWPMMRGVLAGKFTRETRFEDGVRSNWNEGEERAQFLELLDKVERLRPLTSEKRSMAHLTLRFAVAHPAVTCPIPGMKNPWQARENAAAGDASLNAGDLKLIDEVSPPRGKYTPDLG